MAVDPETGFSRVRRRGLRTGYTTGACAAAAARAATCHLVSGKPQREVTIWLPAGREATFTLHRCEPQASGVLASVIKDAGDDPDVTHGAEIRALVEWRDAPGLELRGGEGVGTVTRPGLGLEVGGPAINPVPRQMIEAEVRAALGAEPGQDSFTPRGLRVTISVPGGEALAKKTFNPRLGILGGISILGTTGIVQPYSTASWRASVEQAIDVAAANGLRHVVLATGGRSEKFAMRYYPDLDPLAFVEMAEFTGHALRRCVANRIELATLAGMVGKFAKLAKGHMMTHVAGNQVDPAFLAALAEEAGAPPELAEAMRGANTARHFQELAQAAGLQAVFPQLAQRVAEQCRAYAKGRLAVEALLFDFAGNLLGRGYDG